MSRHIDPPTLSQEECMRTLVGMLTAGWSFRTTRDTQSMAVAVDDDMNLADYMSLLGLSMGLLFNALLSMNIDPEKYIAMLSRQLLEDGI